MPLQPWGGYPDPQLLQQRRYCGGVDSNGLDMVRAGISIYGLYPSDEVAGTG